MTPEDAYCSNCEYDLAGLPQQGSCPECGQYFDRITTEGILKPESHSEQQRRVDKLLARVRTIVLVVLAVAMVLIAMILNFLGVKVTAAAVSLLLAALLALAAITSFVYESSED